ncbi:MAG: MmgE/PrpD family protein [Rhodospirillales bacterium]|nr:MmgE/PrpD family protein [Rhodospirillales bacterium]
MVESVLTRAAEFLRRTNYEHVDPAAISLSKRAIIDYAGCALAGSQTAVAQNVFRWSSAHNTSATATVLGQKARLNAEHAALCNAVAGHALDFDDTSWTTIGHPTSVAASVALAFGELVGATGRDVLTAYAAGIEVGHKMARLTMPATSERGWHTTPVYGTVIAAATAAWLLKPDEDAVISGLGISLSRSGGVRSNFGTMTKPLHAGLAVLAGTESVSMAQEGITASPLAFEAADGFAQCFAGCAADGDVLLGRPWDLAETGLAFKLYPCCSGSHPAVDVMMELVRDGSLTAGMIHRIEVGTSLLGPRELVNHRPQTPLEARFSMEFAVAAVLIAGRLTLDEFTEDFVARRDVQELMDRIAMDIDPDLAKLGFIGTAPVKIRIHLQNGRVIDRSNDLARGNPEKPLTDNDFAAKFSGNACRAIPEARADRLLELLFDLENVKDVSDIMALTRTNR